MSLKWSGESDLDLEPWSPRSAGSQHDSVERICPSTLVPPILPLHLASSPWRTSHTCTWTPQSEHPNSIQIAMFGPTNVHTWNMVYPWENRSWRAWRDPGRGLSSRTSGLQRLISRKGFQVTPQISRPMGMVVTGGDPGRGPSCPQLSMVYWWGPEPSPLCHLSWDWSECLKKTIHYTSKHSIAFPRAGCPSPPWLLHLS